MVIGDETTIQISEDISNTVTSVKLVKVQVVDINEDGYIGKDVNGKRYQFTRWEVQR